MNACTHTHVYATYWTLALMTQAFWLEHGHSCPTESTASFLVQMHRIETMLSFWSPVTIGRHIPHKLSILLIRSLFSTTLDLILYKEHLKHKWRKRHLLPARTSILLSWFLWTLLSLIPALNLTNTSWKHFCQMLSRYFSRSRTSLNLRYWIKHSLELTPPYSPASTHR